MMKKTKVEERILRAMEILENATCGYTLEDVWNLVLKIEKEEKN